MFKENFIFLLALDRMKRIQRSARIDSHVINHPLPFSVTVSFSFLPSSNSDRRYIDTYIYVFLDRSTIRFPIVRAIVTARYVPRDKLTYNLSLYDRNSTQTITPFRGTRGSTRRASRSPFYSLPCEICFYFFLI